ncbi:MAG TPA: 6,7-dimethyl-8-ribityllumazine synthase [Candidatus Methylomirabilis sp.]|nr:6,7-dimethyl-8-ribityllumazine synthase [Candidatus Methylomirabilis sp.]
MAGRAPTAAVGTVGGRPRFAVVVARFNEAICEKLLTGALAVFETHGVAGDAVEVHRVPGSFELPQAALALARTGRYAGIVCAGVVIKGETPHFRYVAGAAAEGIARAALDTGVPMSFGVIVALTEEQAWARAGGAVGNRGEEAALATLEMAGFLRGLKGMAAPRGSRRPRADRRGRRR